MKEAALYSVCKAYYGNFSGYGRDVSVSIQTCHLRAQSRSINIHPHFTLRNLLWIMFPLWPIWVRTFGADIKIFVTY